MNYLDAIQTIGGEFAANDGFEALVDSSAAMIPPAGEENLQTAVDDIRNWIANTQEEFHLEELNFPTPEKPLEFETNATQLPQEEIGHKSTSKSQGAKIVKPNAPKLDMPSDQSGNEASKGDAAAKMVQARGMPDNGITMINPVVAGETARKNRKRKEIAVDVDDNYEKNARFPRRSASLRASQPVAHQNHPGKKSKLSINDQLKVIQDLIPGSQKKDIATTLAEAVEYLLYMKAQELMLQEEVQQLRQAMVMMYQSVQNFMQNPLGTSLNMGVHTQSGGMGFRPPVQPTMNSFSSPVSEWMNMPLLWQQNSAAASRLFVPSQVPGPSQQQRIGQDQIDGIQRTI